MSKNWIADTMSDKNDAAKIEIKNKLKKYAIQNQ